MTKAILEAESEDETRRSAAAVPSPALAVPASLHASLMARLDRLGSAKEVAQIGAAIGRESRMQLLAAVVRKPEAELGSALDRLVAAGLLFQREFRHARPICSSTRWCRMRPMERCCASRGARSTPASPKPSKANSRRLPRASRSFWHVTAPRPGRIEEAASLWGNAGQRSLERSELVEAAEQITRALDQIAAVGSATPAQRREEIKLQVALANALMHVEGYAAPETKAAVEQVCVFLFERAEELG